LTKPALNIVWLKRDLRTQDHEALYNAALYNTPYIIIYIFEPSLIHYPDTAERHLQFQYQSLLAMQHELMQYNNTVHILYGEVITILENLNNTYHIQHLFSYQESGIAATYDRDKRVKQYVNNHNILWQQYERDGIKRGLKNIDGWDKAWLKKMHTPVFVNTYKINTEKILIKDFELPLEFEKKLASKNILMQPGGSQNGFRYLQSFVQKRGINYSKHISKPLLSRTSCGRISPYLAWGNISIRQAYQYTYITTKNKTYKAPFENFMTRLKWHCHFIQKFELEYKYETDCINLGFEKLAHQKNEKYIEAWKNGKTGFPLIDACMRCVIATGWINFRMRAMLVSFFCHHLFQDWRNGVYHLAQQFLDYEPGIHYPQFQMQAGTTGINTIRIYNPIKQSQDHDTEGVFIKKWVPELQNVPTAFIHQPFLMTMIDQQLCNVIIGTHYPSPIINIEQAAKYARDTMWQHRKTSEVKNENPILINKFTRPKSKKTL
jgi:deoxyribodipyrimidine photo-lyase